MQKELVFFETKTGKVPLQRWLKKLRDDKASMRIQKRLRNMERGLYGDHKALQQGIYELRIDEGPGYRVYFAERQNARVVLLLTAGSKRTQKRDIQKAIEYLHDYETRYEDD